MPVCVGLFYAVKTLSWLVLDLTDIKIKLLKKINVHYLSQAVLDTKAAT